MNFLYISRYMLAESSARMALNSGGNDITEFLYVLLDRIGFPYRDVDLARAYDWNVMEDLKARLCTLTEVQLPLCPGLASFVTFFS